MSSCVFGAVHYPSWVLVLHLGRTGEIRVCKATHPAAVVGGWSGRVVPEPGVEANLNSCLAAYSEPCPTGAPFFGSPCCRQSRTKGDSVHWGPEISNSPTCHPGWPRDSQGLRPSSEELAASLEPPPLSERQMQLPKECRPQATSHGNVLGETKGHSLSRPMCVEVGRPFEWPWPRGGT